MNRRRMEITAVTSDGQPFRVKGQTARTLMALVEAGQSGITALEMSTWALRLAAYILDLRRLGLLIQMESEPHEGGWHGRYRILSPVRILAPAQRQGGQP